ncbi:MAG TPA: hypothetical protein H9815_19950, partial [Candidatus Ruania gallistercoris]|nr:hypothetical protein [Candidatus Ruania gallistercoris]
EPNGALAAMVADRWGVRGWGGDMGVIRSPVPIGRGVRRQRVIGRRYHPSFVPEYLGGLFLQITYRCAQLAASPGLSTLRHRHLPARLGIHAAIADQELEYILESGAEPFTADRKVEA